MKQLTIKNLLKFPLWYKGDAVVKLPDDVLKLAHSIREKKVTNPWGDPGTEREFWAELKCGRVVPISSGDFIEFKGNSLEVSFDKEYYKKHGRSFKTYRLPPDEYNSVYMSRYGYITNDPTDVEFSRIMDKIGNVAISIGILILLPLLALFILWCAVLVFTPLERLFGL